MSDVAESDIDPVVHYFDYGEREGRRPSLGFDPAYYLESNPKLLKEKNLLGHFLRYGKKAKYLPTRQLAFSRPRQSPRKFPIRSQLRSIYENSNFQPARPPVDRFVVYTAIVGKYDNLAAVNYRPAGCDFVVFSDQSQTAEGWELRPLDYIHEDPTRAARFVKLHPHTYLPKYDYSIWIDANISIYGDIGVFFDRLSSGAFISAFRHPLRSCIYDEGLECIVLRKDDGELITRQLQGYRTAGIPDEIGLWETNVLVRRHNDPRCIEFMTAWWRELERGSRRDQLSFPMVQRSLRADVVDLDTPGIAAHHHPLLKSSPHRSSSRQSVPDR